ncbi:glycosyltransferase family 117 protein [Pedobacter sp. MW01-1-1]|uniref:glycosyltransferase family 117 protein n=1 Tax=Pedobacter sp. MW01-1-1 TaxID=3383027 RepID=UPI003FF07144
MNYSKINNIVGWLCFLIATITYVLTLEPSASFWDCGEFIASAYRMQVVHQPGAPLFLMIQRFFSIFALGDKTNIAYWMNIGSAISSAATILFLFWTITALAKKAIIKAGEEISTSQLISIIGAGTVGALAYTFSDSFWFSAVESEVYAQSSLFTAIVFWAILKWEAHADEPRADRWLLFIAYIMGLSIGIHLLNLLTIPAIAFIYYFKKAKKVTSGGIFKAFLVGVFILGIIQYGIIQYLVSFGAYFDLFFVNTLGLGFGTGVLFFALLLIGGFVYGIRYSIKHQKKLLNLGLISAVLIIFGYASFAMIIIRAKADPNLNNSAPKDAFSFLSYLNREQYGDRPLAYGPNYNSERTGVSEGKTIWRKDADKYVEAGKKTDYTYDNNTLLPRMYSDDAKHVAFYKEWMHFDDSKKPNLVDNIGFLASYQIGYMYMRYFLWNFAGRQNDEQGQGSGYEGEWLSGIKAVDAARLGNLDHLPPSTTENPANNHFYFLPLILGILGAIWHFNRSQKDAGVVAMLFFFTGIAIVLYLNQKPLEPRERDYAYVGSFYAFAIWIGLGVLAIKEYVFKKLTATTGAIAATVIGLLIAPAIMAEQGWDDHDRSTKLVAHDIALDYLESCAPNAILFTYGDNDTYPLWYIQEVENVRPDVRIVNLSLFDTDWYINGMRMKQNESAPLPLTMTPNQYVQGVRDVLPYDDYKIAGSIELKNVVDLLLSDSDEDKVPMQDGSKSNFLPTKNFKLTINPQEVISTGTIPAADAAKIAPVMEWQFNKGYVTKGSLAMLDILAHNNWKRPIYFASTVPSDQYNGLDKYLYNEGLALRLLPLKADTTASEDRQELLNTPQLYNNVMTKFKFGNMKTARYLDPQSSDDTFIFTNIFSSLTSSLIKEGKTEEAKKVLAKYFEVMPDKFFGIRTAMVKFYISESLYKVGETAKANDVLLKSGDFINKELIFLADLTESKGSLTGMNNIQTGLYYLDRMIKTSNAAGQVEVSKKLQKIFDGLEQRFSRYFQGGPGQ